MMIVTLLPLLLPALDPKIPFILALCLQLLTPTCPLNSALRKKKKGNVVTREYRLDITLPSWLSYRPSMLQFGWIE